MKFTIKSNAKINIGLNVEGKLPNGYHLLDMVMVPISLSDILDIEFVSVPGDLHIDSNKEDIPRGPENILYKVYEKFYKKTGLKKEEIKIFLEKNIPHEAGLGGGSSNGALFLKLLNEHHKNILSLDEMLELGKTVGADIPFFILNRPCRVQGIGEKLEEIENNLNCKLIVIKPNFGVSTAKAYKNVGEIKSLKKGNIEQILEGLKRNSLDMVRQNIENSLEQGLLLDNEDIIGFRKELASFGELEFFMSGSGSAYFAFVERDRGELYLDKLEKGIKNCEVYLCDFQ